MQNPGDKVIISLAPVAGNGPLIPEKTAEDVIYSIDAGAAMCHLHAKTREGLLSEDITEMKDTFAQITAGRDVVVQASTGGISRMNILKRCMPLSYERVESASLNGGSTNLGEAVYINSFEDIRYVTRQCYEKQILPEIEVFDIGMIHNICLVMEECPHKKPLLFNLVFGHRGGMQATIEALYAFRSFVPAGALWGITHFGRDNWTFLAAAIAMGAVIVRIGFEDSDYLEQGRRASYNYELVEKLAGLVRTMGLKTASAKEAREILGLHNPINGK